MSRGLSWAEMGEEARTEYWPAWLCGTAQGLGPAHARGFCVRSVQPTPWCSPDSAGARQGLPRNRRPKWPPAHGASRPGRSGICAALTPLSCYGQTPNTRPRCGNCRTPPYCCTARGDISLLQAPAFAIVGSRRSTEHGRTVAAHMALRLSSCGVTIVSGMALGIDRVAHEAALARIGRSIGVLGTGIDVIYPRGNRGAFDAMREHGLLISEFMPGALPLPSNISPVRNRIISALPLAFWWWKPPAVLAASLQPVWP